MSKLIIVESPAKANTIKKYLGKDFDVVASKGHIRDLPAAKLQIPYLLWLAFAAYLNLGVWSLNR